MLWFSRINCVSELPNDERREFGHQKKKNKKNIGMIDRICGPNKAKQKLLS